MSNEDDRKKGDRHQDKTPSMGKPPYVHTHVLQNGTTRYWSEQANNPSEAWFQGGTGAFEICDPDGSTSKFCPGESRIEHESLSVTISENSDTHVGGHMTIKSKGGLEMEVTGEGNITIAGATAINILDNAGIAVQGNATLSIKGTMSIDADAVNIRSKGAMTLGSGGAMSIQAAGGIAMQPNGSGADGYSTSAHSPAKSSS